MIFLFERESFAGNGGRHEFVFVFAVGAGDIRSRRVDRGRWRNSRRVLEGSFLCVQSEVCFAVLVRAVAMKAVLGEEGRASLWVDGRLADAKGNRQAKGSVKKVGRLIIVQG